MSNTYHIPAGHNHEGVYVKVGEESGVTDHGALTGLGDNDHPQYLLTTGKAADSDKLDGYDSADFGRPVFLTTPLTSTDWDGDAYSTTAKTKIDLSEVFGVPAGVKAVLIEIAINDSGSAAGTSNVGPWIIIGGVSTAYVGSGLNLQYEPNDAHRNATMIVACDANGDIYYQINASGTDTMDVIIKIWGWWL